MRHLKTFKKITKMLDFLKEHQDVDIQKYQMEKIKTKR